MEVEHRIRINAVAWVKKNIEWERKNRRLFENPARKNIYFRNEPI